MSDLSHLSGSERSSIDSNITNEIKERELLPYGVMFERAKSNRSTCKNCSQLINAGELRFGRETFAQYGVKMQWFHPTCAFTLNISEDSRSKCKICSDKINVGEIKLLAGCINAPSSSTKFHYHCFQDHGLPSDSYSNLQKLLRDAKTTLETNGVTMQIPSIIKAVTKKIKATSKASLGMNTSSMTMAKDHSKDIQAFTTATAIESTAKWAGVGDTKKRKISNSDLTIANLSTYPSVPSILNTTIMTHPHSDHSSSRNTGSRKDIFHQYGLDTDYGANSNDEGSAESGFVNCGRVAYGGSNSSGHISL